VKGAVVVNSLRTGAAIIAATAFVAHAVNAPPAHAGFYAGWGTLAFNRAGPDFSLCFAGDAVDTRADRVLNVLDHVRHVEWAANIRFHPPGNKSIRIQSGKPLVATDWRCPDTAAKNGQLPAGDLGDIRVLLHTTANATWWDANPVGGEGCAIVNHGSSWGATGNEPKVSKWCNFNLKLGDDAPPGTTNYYLNHTLHEFGHKLGFGHDHNRSDAVCASGNVPNGSVGQETNAAGTLVSSDPAIFMTAFDKASVMNYVIAACGSKGNYDFTGFSAYDRLALRILYPETGRVAELMGVRVIRTGQPLRLGSLWKYLGAMVDTGTYSVARNFTWTIDGSLRATTPDLNTPVSEGAHTLVYSYQDLRGRSYTFKTRIEVLSPAKFAQRMASQSVIIGADPY
jgi:hypothetical protein